MKGGRSEVRERLRAEIPDLQRDRERLRQAIASEPVAERRLRRERDLAAVEAQIKGLRHILGEPEDEAAAPPSSPDD